MVDWAYCLGIVYFNENYSRLQSELRISPENHLTAGKIFIILVIINKIIKYLNLFWIFI